MNRYRVEISVNQHIPSAFYVPTYAEARAWIDGLAEGIAWKITDLETGETVIEVLRGPLKGEVNP